MMDLTSKYQLHFKIDIGKGDNKVPATVVIPGNTITTIRKHMRIVKRALYRWPYDFALHDEAGMFIRKLV